MMRMRLLLSALFLVLLTMLPAARAQTLVSGRAKAPPTIDGQPTDPCWQNAMVATDFSVLASAGKERAFRQTTVRAAWDREALYFHIICLEPDPASVTAKVTERDGSTWLEDAIEIFLQPDAASPRVFHFISNARGTLYDEVNRDASFNAEISLAAVTGPDAWQVEMSIPWGQIRCSAPAFGDEWGFNVGREHRPQEPTEWSTWAPLEERTMKFGLPKLFGRLRFADIPVQGRATKQALPAGLVTNPDFTEQAGSRPRNWHLRARTRCAEIAPMSRHYGLRNDGDYGIVSQQLDVPVTAGEVFTVYAVVRGSKDTRAGIAVVQEMDDGRPDDLYPFWKLAVTEQFQLYSGRIVVDTGAKRFKTVSLYRANRAGWIEYAYVQVIPGMHGVAGIVDARRCTSPDERGLGPAWETPALKVYNPLPRGKLKTLIFIGEFQRDAAELAQRLDMDYDLVYCPNFRTSRKVDAVVAYDADAVLRKLLRQHYDLIILAGRPSEQTVITGISEAVRRGAGVLTVDPLTSDPARNPAILGDLLGSLPADLLGNDDTWPLLGTTGQAVLKHTSRGKTLLQSVTGGKFGAGNVVRLKWSEKVPGLIPFRPGTGEYWEYRWATLCQAALWVAGRQSAPRLTLSASKEAMTAVLRSNRPGQATLRVDWDTPGGILHSEQLDTIALSPTAVTRRIPVPDMLKRVRGACVARLIMSQDGHPVQLGACVLPTFDPRMEILDIAAPSEAEPDAAIDVTVTYQAAAVNDLSLRIELVDAFKRTIDRRTVTGLATGRQELHVELRVRRPLSVCHRIVVTACDGDTPVAHRLSRGLSVPSIAAHHLDDFQLGVGYAAMSVRCPEYLHDHLVAFLRAHGATACTVNKYMIERGMPAWGGTVCGGGMANKASGHARRHCFSNPETVEALATRTVANVGKRRPWGFVGYNLHDEVHLHQPGTVEVCNSEHCRHAFRLWARETYGSLSAANASWETNYATFDDITVPLIAEMKGITNPARWVDFRLFMEQTWAHAYQAVHEAVIGAHPDARLSFTNPYRYNSLSGTDFARWIPHEEVLLRYFHRHVIDRHRSWSRAPMLAWFGYRQSASEVGRFPWWFAFNGGVMPIWWDPVEPWAYAGKDGFTPWNLFGPLWRETGRSRAVSGAVKDLQAGIGKLLRLAEPAPPEAVILHSQASMHVLYAEACLQRGRVVDDGYKAYRRADDSMAGALKRRGLQYTYLTPEQLRPDALGSIQLVALPACVALPNAVVETLQAYVAAGGRLLADRMPATHDEHGKPRITSPLMPLFEGAMAHCLGGIPDDADSGLLDEGLTKLGAHPRIRWHTEDGGLPKSCELYQYALGTAQFIGLVQGAHGDAAEDGPLILELSEPAHVFDCRRHEDMGQRESITMNVPAGDAALFALLPYRPGALALRVELKQRQLVVKATLAGTPSDAVHVFRIEVVAPGSQVPVCHYARNVASPEAAVGITIPLALRNSPGMWRLSATDVVTGASAKAEVTMPGE